MAVTQKGRSHQRHIERSPSSNSSVSTSKHPTLPRGEPCRLCLITAHPRGQSTRLPHLRCAGETLTGLLRFPSKILVWQAEVPIYRGITVRTLRFRRATDERRVAPINNSKSKTAPADDQELDRLLLASPDSKLTRLHRLQSRLASR